MDPTLLGIVGAGLAGAALAERMYSNWRQRQRQKPRADFKLVHFDSSGDGPDRLALRFRVHVQAHDVPVQVVGFFLSVPDAVNMHFNLSRYPYPIALSVQDQTVPIHIEKNTLAGPFHLWLGFKWEDGDLQTVKGVKALPNMVLKRKFTLIGLLSTGDTFKLAGRKL